MDSGSSHQPRRILVIDDDPIVLAVATLLLETEGHTVLQAPSGEAALEILATSEPPHCILADLRMPSLSGSDLARALRQAAPKALILAMSATPPAEIDGYDAILKKPLTGADLTNALACRPKRRKPAKSANGALRPSRKAAPKAREVLDLAVFERLQRAVSGPALEEVFSVFFSDTRARVATMRSADPDTIRREAHTVKGGAAMVGALLISRAAAAVETGIDNPGDRSRKLDEIEAHCQHTELILRQRLK